ncbi:restriction endonuclease [Streptomyces noursei]|uniref:restriction endonuclease n=1 Tax=Streptomyces noursei TaxID=1971 RepID=UPI0023B7D7C3|nr:restriction endonuclease [Streptomyces noursei]
METWNTQASKEEGVDAVAISQDPIFTRECIIQAKRYAKLVGVESFRHWPVLWSANEQPGACWSPHPGSAAPAMPSPPRTAACS